MTAKNSKNYEQVFQPGIVLVIEPNAVSADGMFGIFFAILLSSRKTR